jgi:outer membrane protein assembly factor BamA
MELRLTSDQALPKGIKTSYDYRSNSKVNRLKTEIIHELYKKGYLEAGIDGCDSLVDGMQCKLNIGDNYQWALLRIGNLGKEVASASGFREKLFRDAPLSPFELGSLMEDILDHYENNGYPFASVELDSLLFDDNGVNAALKVNRNALVRIDSVIIKGSMKTAPVLIHEQIGINPGDLYDENRLETIPKRLKELAFVRSRAEPYVLFSKEETKLYLFLDDKKASSVTGILGVLPNDVTGKITFTGDLDLHLISALRRGETIRLEWRRLQDQTQDLKAGFNYPFLFNSPFGLDASLAIYRRDTSFLDVGTLLGASIRLDQGDKVTGFIRRNSSSRLGKRDTFTPGLADTKTTSYGVTIERDRTDYRRNPRRGHRLTLTGAAGKKTSERLNTNDEDEIQEERTAQYDIQGKAGTFIAIGKRGTIYSGVQGGSMINDVLYNNELFRIGGFKDQRGVDDVSITASSYAVATLEYRLLLEENSNLFLFVDQGWWENRAEETPTRDTPVAFGVGTNFETTAGIFSLSYALGKQFDNPFQFNNAKVHFGFASLF